MSGARPDTWMPLHIGPYVADTMHLSRDQHGGYLLLIFAYWRRGGPLPDDDAYLSAVAKASPQEWRKLRAVLEPFFRVSNGVWWHKRIEAELSKAIKQTEAKRNAGRIGGEAARGKSGRKQKNDENNGERIADELQTNDEKIHLNPNLNPSLRSEESPRKPPRGRLSGEDLKAFETWYAIYPRHDDRGHAEPAFLKALHLATLEELIDGARRYARICADKEPKFIALPATWLNGKRWLDGQSPAGNGVAIPERRTPQIPPPALPAGWDECF